jgi:GTP-binding protein
VCSETDSADTFLVSGRGELHLAILIETMRREGYEFHVSRPEVIMHTDDDGTQMEPYEEVHIEVPPDAVGLVIEMLGHAPRRDDQDGRDQRTIQWRLSYIVPTRGLLGFRYQFLTATRGRGIMSTHLSRLWTCWLGRLPCVRADRSSPGRQASQAPMGLRNAEPRGILFIGRVWMSTPAWWWVNISASAIWKSMSVKQRR